MKSPILKHFLSYYRPYKKIFVVDLMFALIFSLCGLVYPILTRTILDDLIPAKDITMIVICCVSLLVIYIVRAVMDYLVCYHGHKMGVMMQADMRSDLFVHLEKLPYKYYDNQETGQLMARMTNDLFNVSELAHHGPENIFIATLMTVGSFVYLCTINWILALIVVLVLPFMVVITYRSRKAYRRALTQSKEEIGNLNASLENSLAGLRVTKAYNNAAHEKARFEKGNQGYVKARGHAYKAMGSFHSTMGFMTCLYNVLVLVTGALFCVFDYESFDYADLTAFMLSINLFVSPIQTLINFFELLEDGATGYKRFYEILKEDPERDADGAVVLEDVKGDICFDNVSFSYHDGEPILKNINLHVEAGKTYALVGASGDGKTTICHLIPRFYVQEEGEISVDGIPTSQITLQSLRAKVGIVQQDVFLFTGTFRDNIAYGNLNATDEEVVEAAKLANLHDYIASLPDGYNTQIGERGVRLSGGQKQRLSIARVFLKNPPILILDEATSALDNATEALIQQSLYALAKGRTTLVVAHRLSTVRHADCIVVVEHGEIVEMGTHDELLANKGAYYHLCNITLDAEH